LNYAAENVVYFKVKCINLVLFERSKLRASTHELLVEQRKRIDLCQDNKEGSNIFLVESQSTLHYQWSFRIPNNYYNNDLYNYSYDV